MTERFGSPKYWHERAEEVRATAEGMKDAEAKRAMLVIAGNYEKIAKRAEAREAGVDLSSPRAKPDTWGS